MLCGKRSGLIWMLLTALLLIACGAPSAEVTPTPGTSTPSPSPTAVPTSPASPTPEATQSATRTIKHAMGTTEVPAHPKRVVVLDTGELDTAMTLGVKPVGAVEAIAGEGLPAYLQGTEGIQLVGTINEPNLEKIAALKPDLILSSKMRHETIYKQLSQIAPTVFAERTGVTWKENFDLFARALGKEEEAERVKQEYQAHVQEFRRKMGDRLKQTEVTVIRFLPGDTRLYQKESFIGTVLEDLGLPRPPSQDVNDFAMYNVSEEFIPQIGGDVIFVTVYGNEADTAKRDFMTSPLWEKLEAVRAGRVYEVSDDLWMLGIGYTAANGVIDDLERYLLGEGAQTTPTAASGEGTSAFPVTIEHKYGKTVIQRQPKRVVVIGFNDQDPVLALGVKPVAIRDWFGNQPYGVWPWARDELGDAKPVLLPSGDLNFEQISALKPDLIVGISSGMTDKDYRTLSKIAPTIAQPKGYVEYGTPWQEQTRIIGRALGKEQEAEELVSKVEAQIEAVRRQYPQLEGATGLVAARFEGTLYVYGEQDSRGRFLSQLGMRMPKEVADLAADQFYATLSQERMDLLDVDALIWLIGDQDRRELESDPIYTRLKVHTEGRDIFLESNSTLSGAISFSTVLSIPYTLEHLVPQLVDALDGKPSSALPVGYAGASYIGG